MFAQAGIHYWRDWVIREINRDLPYDQFVQRNLHRLSHERTRVSALESGLGSSQADDMFFSGSWRAAAFPRQQGHGRASDRGGRDGLTALWA
jgi:hypothetical protein